MNIRLKLMLGAAALIAAGMLAASEAKVITFNTPADWNQKEPVVVVSDGVLTVMNKVFLESDSFPVDPTKTYTLSLSVRTENAPVDERSRVLAGFNAFDIKGKLISHRSSDVIDGTLTKTVEDAAKGATVIKVKDASKFATRNAVVVTGAKADFSDLPNFNIAGMVEKVAKKGEVWEITLQQPLKKEIKAGTTIREHAMGGHIYTAGSRRANEVWRQMSGSIKGIAKSGWSFETWPAGTVRASVIILVDWDDKGIDTQLKDITLAIE